MNEVRVSLYKNIVLCSSICLISCLATTTYAEVNLPDAGTVLKQMESDIPRPTAKSDQTFFEAATSDTNYSRDTTPIRIDQVIFTGNQTLADQALRPLVCQLEGHEVVLADIEKAVDALTQYYRQQGYFLAKAYLPKQKLEQGQLTIRILEGQLGAVELNNQSRVRDGVLKKYTDQLPLGQALALDQSNRTLLLISDLYGIGQIQANVHAGQELGQTDLLIGLGQQKAWAGRVGLDNTGSSYTGKYRFSSYVEGYSLLGYGEKLSIQLQHSNHDLRSGSVAAQFPVLGNGLMLGGGFSRTEYELGEQFAILEAQGVSESYNLNVFYPLIRRQAENINLRALLEQRQLLDKIAVTETRTDKSSIVMRMTVDASRQDEWGIASAKGGINQIDFILSLGQLDIEAPSSHRIDQLSAKTHGSFRKYELKLARQQWLAPQWVLGAELYGQLASKNLDSSEKFSFAKMRGYPSVEVLGDQGWGASVNLYYQFKPYLNAFIFQDVGQSEQNKTAYTTEDNRHSLASTGLGVGGLYQQFDYNLTLAWRNTDPARSDKDQNPRLQFQAGFRF